MTQTTYLLAGTALAFSLCVSACRSTTSTDVVAAEVERHDAGVVDALRLPATSPDAGRSSGRSAAEVDSGCVLDMGESRKGERLETDRNGITRIVRPQPRCWLEADCVHDHRRQTPGDASVAIQCRGRRCVCSFESFVPKAKPVEFTFDVEEPCADDATIERLLFDRCVPEGRRRTTSRRH